LNWHLPGTSDDTGWVQQFTEPRSRNTWTKESDIAMIGEASTNSPYIIHKTTMYSGDPWSGYAYNRHRQAANFLFADSHVESLDHRRVFTGFDNSYIRQ
jgi:prepilin-type processing-associated H-X9-DG protein